MIYNVGTLLNMNGLEGRVIGYIEYMNTQDNNNTWIEYRIMTKRGECWLSRDEIYKEYTISWPNNHIRGQIGPEWHEVDRGVQKVKRSVGDVDVDIGEIASFIEYEDEEEEHTLSVENWSDGTEFSTGEYIEPEDIVVTGYEKPRKNSSRSSSVSGIFVFFICFTVFSMVAPTMLNSLLFPPKSISKFLKNSINYTYETSITGNQKQKADIYVYTPGGTTDDVAKNIIDGIEGYTESVTQKDDTTNQEIAIVTSKEYCLIYHPEGDMETVYVQISSRKYNYTSDNTPYRCSSSSSIWYRSHYYSSSYASDSVSYKNTPSAYSSYDGTIVHNIGNGYFDTYSSSVKQDSINSRNSSGGGLSSGK